MKEENKEVVFVKILVINCGSSSLKYQLIDMNNESVLTKGLVERIGIDGAKLEQKTPGKEKYIVETEMKDHKKAIELVFTALTDEKFGAVKSLDEIGAIGHRVVHGGEKITESTLVDEEVKSIIEDCFVFAPLHNPANLLGIKACEEIAPGKPNVAVFDTAFHQTMPASNYMYAIPYEYYEKYGLRKYGFHGTSHNFITNRMAEILKKEKSEINIVTLHLGNGSSLAAIKSGKCYDTTMGLTPLEGLVMGTRSGDLDATVVTFLQEKENLSPAEINNILNKKSGVLGVSQLSSDFRDLENAAKEGNKQAQLALDMFVGRVKKYLGAYMAQLGRVDAIVFTGGIGENSKTMRADIVAGMEELGLVLDIKKNDMRGEEALISTDESKIKIYVVPTNEELMIARDTLRFL